MTNTQEAFEKWHKTTNRGYIYKKTELGEYIEARVDIDYQIWQANQANNDAVIAELVEALEDTRKEMPHNSFNHDVNLYRRIDALIAKHKKCTARMELNNS